MGQTQQNGFSWPLGKTGRLGKSSSLTSSNQLQQKAVPAQRPAMKFRQLSPQVTPISNLKQPLKGVRGSRKTSSSL